MLLAKMTPYDKDRHSYNSSLVMRIFSEVTIFVKCWATRRGIYNFNLGFLNGISIMILVANALQRFIKA